MRRAVHTLGVVALSLWPFVLMRGQAVEKSPASLPEAAWEILADGSRLYISEFIAANQETLADGDGDFSDWIEIYNPTSATVDLTSGYHGSLVGNPRPAWVEGPADHGRALQFDGQAGSYVDLGDVDVNIGSRFTLACWVNAPPAALGRFGVILAKRPKDAGHCELYLNGSTSGGRTEGGAAMYAPDLGDFWSGYVVPDGTWHHLISIVSRSLKTMHRFL